MKNSKYDNILNAPPWEPRSHPRMPMSKRAAQFQPFDPLEGYDEAVNETARETDAERYLDETTVASLNATLAELNARIEEQPAVTVTYFVPDMKLNNISVKHSIAQRAIRSENFKFLLLHVKA